MMDAMQLGVRLRAARERRGLSQQSVADALALPRTAVTNIELGIRVVSMLELSKLATLYAQPAAYFFGTEPAAEEPSAVLARALPEMMNSPEFDTAVHRMLDLWREGAALRAMINERSEHAIPNYGAHLITASEAIRQAETVAGEERCRLGLGNAPIGNLAALISAQGIWAAATRLPDSLSGLFLNHSSTGIAILVNNGHWQVRRRFSYAHEYAHALFDRHETIAITRRDNATALVEKRANAFAAAFLMPLGGITDHLRQINKGHPSRQAQVIFDVANNETIEAEIRSRPGSQAITYQDVAEITQHFGVSYEATVWRLKSLNYLSATDTNALIEQKEIAKRYMRLVGFFNSLEEGKESEPAEQELRVQLTRFAIEAFRRGKIPRRRLIELANKINHNPVDAAELVKLCEATSNE